MSDNPVGVSGKHIFITGASGGFGRHFATFLAAQGASVSIAARRLSNLQQLQSEIESAGASARAIELDVTRPDFVKAALAQAEQTFGPVQVLVNNAGVPAGGRAQAADVDDYDALMQVNLRGAWLVAVETARAMIANEVPGSIINIASILGERVGSGLSLYSMSKAGVVQMTKSHALEWARYGIRVNVLQPGYFSTPLNQDMLESEAGARLVKRIPFRRTGEIHELEGPLLLLASDASSYMSGSVVSVDGGHLVSGL